MPAEKAREGKTGERGEERGNKRKERGQERGKTREERGEEKGEKKEEREDKREDDGPGHPNWFRVWGVVILAVCVSVSAFGFPI